MKTANEIFKKIATAKGWTYIYGRDDFQNLIDPADTTWHLVISPPEYSIVSKTKYTVSGLYSLLSKSHLDQTYTDGMRWEQNIQPKIISIYDTINETLGCDYNSELSSLTIKEVINIFDANLDGIAGKYSFELYE